MSMSAYLLLIFIACLSNSKAQEDYQEIALQDHNKYRALHQVPDLALDDDLNNAAMECARHYMSIGQIDHSCLYKNDAGENLFWGSGQGEDTDVAKIATDMWYNEEEQYDYNNPGFSLSTGHFTQLVWKVSTLLGFGIAEDENGNTYACALYSPPGNFGESEDYDENVLPANDIRKFFT